MLTTFTEETKFRIYDEHGVLKGFAIFHNEDEEYVYVDASPHSALYQYTKENEEVHVVYFNQDGSSYQFDSKIIGKQLTDYGILGIEKTKNVVAMQRRKNYRVPVEIRVECIPAGRYDTFEKRELDNLNLILKNYDDQKGECTITDLNAEGAGILIRNDKIRTYDKIVLIIPTKEKYIVAVGNVVKISDVVVEYSRQKRVGLKFYTGSRNYADRIYEFVFDIMRNDAIRARQEEKKRLEAEIERQEVEEKEG